MGYPHFSADCHGYHALVRDFGGPRPEIVCLCGSTRFYDAFQQANYDLTMAGSIVLAPGVWVRSDPAYADLPEEIRTEAKIDLDELHKRKIDLADRVLVINVGGYIGESTRDEIDYAVKIGKPVHYLEEI